MDGRGLLSISRNQSTFPLSRPSVGSISLTVPKFMAIMARAAAVKGTATSHFSSLRDSIRADDKTRGAHPRRHTAAPCSSNRVALARNKPIRTGVRACYLSSLSCRSVQADCQAGGAAGGAGCAPVVVHVKGQSILVHIDRPGLVSHLQVYGGRRATARTAIAVLDQGGYHTFW